MNQTCRCIVLSVTLSLWLGACGGDSNKNAEGTGGATGSGGGAVGMGGAGGRGGSSGTGGTTASTGGTTASTGGTTVSTGGTTVSTGGTTVSTGGTTGGGGGASGTGGAACSTFPNSAAAVQEIQLAETIPTAGGGTIVAGTYFLTTLAHYTGPGGSTLPTDISFKTTVVIAPTATAGEWDYQNVTAQDAGRDNRSTYRAVVSGMSINLNRVCPNTTNLGGTGFTAAGDILKLFNTIQSNVETYTRQP